MLKANKKLSRFEHPPINEVVCGVAFKRIPGIDAYTTGDYWKTRREDFPKREARPPFVPLHLITGTPAQTMPSEFPVSNTWLISADDSRVLQIQDNRLHLNWRRVSIEDRSLYPRFHSRESKGLLDQFIREYAIFSQFIQQNASVDQQAPSITEVSLSKIDHLMQGVHWNDASDIIKLIPSISSFTDLKEQDQALPRFNVSFNESSSSLNAGTSIVTAFHTDPSGKNHHFLRLESTVYLAVDDNLERIRTGLECANDHLNAIFSNLIPNHDQVFVSLPQ